MGLRAEGQDDQLAARMLEAARRDEPLDPDALKRMAGVAPDPREEVPRRADDEVARRRGYTAAELLTTDFPEPRWAVPGIIPEGLTLIAGAPKLGKSWLALNLSLAVAAGGRALGKVPVERAPVVYLALEDNPRRLKSRLQTILNGHGAPDGLTFHTEWARLDEGGVDELDRIVAELGRPLVLVDVLARVRSLEKSRESVYARDYAALSGLKGLADRHGIPVGVFHHVRKAGSDDYLDTVSGTHGLAGAADTVIVMRRSRGQADAELHVTGRDVVESSYAMRFDPAIGSWSLLGDAGEWALSDTRRRLLEAVREHGGLSPKAAAVATGLDYELVKKTLRRMGEDGQIDVADGMYTPSLVSLVSLESEGQRDSRDSTDRRLL